MTNIANVRVILYRERERSKIDMNLLEDITTTRLKIFERIKDDKSWICLRSYHDNVV